MKKQRKNWLHLLAVLICIGMLAGCGEKQENYPVPTPIVSQEATNVPTATEAPNKAPTIEPTATEAPQ